MTVLVFGASGTLGSQTLRTLIESGQNPVGIYRSNPPPHGLLLDSDEKWIEHLKRIPEIKAAVFAQGVNFNDEISDPSSFDNAMEANLLFVIRSLSKLLNSGILRSGGSVVIVSSVWQEFSRPNKLSYSVTKSALRGLVNSLVADLAPKGIRVNAVLPGVVDSSMTRSVLSEQVLMRIKEETPSGFLVTANEVASVISWLVSNESNGVIGQFIRVDNGWTNVRLVP